MSSPIKESPLDTMQHRETQDTPQECSTTVDELDVSPFESLFADSFQRDHRQELAEASKGRSVRRRNTRRALDANLIPQWEEAIYEHIAEHSQSVHTTTRALQFGAFVAGRFGRTNHSGSANCLHCSLESALRFHRERVAAWKQHLALGPSSPQMLPKYEPPVRRAIDERGYEYTVEDHELLPEFDEIDWQHLKPATLRKAINLVSFMPNWVWEESGVQVAHATHEWTSEVVSTPVLRTWPDTGKVLIEHQFTKRRFRKLTERKPKMKRDYPGTHYIGWSNNQSGERDSFRILITTIWLERHERYAVYCAWDGGKPNGARFTEWVPFAWHLVEPSTADLRADYDPKFWDLDRALEIASLKAHALRVEFGIDQPQEPLPFSPDRLKRIADAQDSGVERSRSRSGPVEE